jgi:hypothetical protein
MAANSAGNGQKDQTETDKQTLLAVLQFLKKQNLKVKSTSMLFILKFSSWRSECASLVYGMFIISYEAIVLI